MTQSNGSVALEVEGLGKCYRTYPSALGRVLERASCGRLRNHREIWALRGIDLRLAPGASLGLCGANGAGKSTLLAILAGTTAPTVGRFRAHGRVASLLELGTGFHLDFTGRANILQNGVMMGLTRREVARKLDAIVDFAGLGEHVDEPVRTYSTGMGLRLAFAVATAVDPDLLLLDEVFAVGDMAFQRRCVDKVLEFKRRGRTILFCSHSLQDVRQLCDEALWLHEGEVRRSGEATEVTNAYADFQREHLGVEEALGKAFVTGRSSEAAARAQDVPRILDARVHRLGSDEECTEIESGDSIEVRVWWRNPTPDETPIQLGVGFLREDLTVYGGTSTQFAGVALRGSRGCTVLRVRDLGIAEGRVLVPVFLLDGRGVHRYQEFLTRRNLVVRPRGRSVGIFRLEHAWADADLEPPPSVARPRSGEPARRPAESEARAT